MAPALLALVFGFNIKPIHSFASLRRSLQLVIKHDNNKNYPRYSLYWKWTGPKSDGRSVH